MVLHALPEFIKVNKKRYYRIGNGNNTYWSRGGALKEMDIWKNKGYNCIIREYAIGWGVFRSSAKSKRPSKHKW